MKHGRDDSKSNTRVYKVKGLTEKAADNSYFESDQGGAKMTVAQYFEQSYGIKCAPFQLAAIVWHVACQVRVGLGAFKAGPYLTPAAGLAGGSHALRSTRLASCVVLTCA